MHARLPPGSVCSRALEPRPRNLAHSHELVRPGARALLRGSAVPPPPSCPDGLPSLGSLLRATDTQINAACKLTLCCTSLRLASNSLTLAWSTWMPSFLDALLPSSPGCPPSLVSWMPSFPRLPRTARPTENHDGNIRSCPHAAARNIMHSFQWHPPPLAAHQWRHRLQPVGGRCVVPVIGWHAELAGVAGGKELSQ